MSSQPNPAPVFVPNGEGKLFWGPGDTYRFLVTGSETNGGCFILEAVVPPGGGPPPHLHEREDEYFYVLEGALTVSVADDTRTVHAGDFVHVRPGTPHWFRNDGTAIARMLAVFTPAGMEGYFQECLDPAPDRVTMPPPPSDALIQKMIAAGPKYGVAWVR